MITASRSWTSPTRYNITAAASITDGGSLELEGADGIATFESGGRIYAAVTASVDNGVQILDITNPLNITAAASITDSTSLELEGASGIATFESGGHTYAAATGYDEHGVQIIRVDITLNDMTPPVITLTGPNPAMITEGDRYTPGTICTDNADAVPMLTSNSTVVTSTPGTYVLGYTCTDAAGIMAEPMSQIVIVNAALPPVITLEGFSTGTITVDDAYTDAGATCRDDVDDSPTLTSTSNVTIGQVGTYAVTYFCTNAAEH